MRTIDKGTLAELKVRTALAEAGYRTLIPDHILEYDLVFEEAEKFYRVQVKHGKWRDGAVVVDSRRRGPKRPEEPYTEVDFFGVWCSANDKCYLVPAGLIPGSHISLRVEATRNGQTKGIHKAAEYEICPCSSTD